MEKKNNIILLASQKVSIAHSLQYSLQILEMNNIQLREYIQTTLVENPFLTEDENNYETFSSIGSDFLENLAEKKTFKDELVTQMCFLNFSDDQKEIAELLFDNVIDNKYLNSEILKNISQEKNISYFEILKIIKQLQTLFPHGLFSFNIKDKIKSELVAAGKYSGYHKMIVQNIDSILIDGFASLKNKYNLDDFTIQQIKADIKSLKINFDFCFDHDDLKYKIPDLIVENKVKNEYESSINDCLLPQLSVDKNLYEKAVKNCHSNNDIVYIKEKIDSAKLLVKSINYRNSTLLKIVKEIVHRQQDFLSGYNFNINPISVKSIANILMLHEGTVHRAIANKSISTPLGIFDIKTLMPSEVKSKINNNLVSSHSVKTHIKNLINQEPKNNPYSDECIMHFLNSKGIVISRRTIAKYRNTLDIPKVAQRVKFYKITEISV